MSLFVNFRRFVFSHLPIPLQIKLKKEVHILFHNAGIGDTIMATALAESLILNNGDIRIHLHGFNKEILKHNPFITSVTDEYRGFDVSYHTGRINAGKHLEKNLVRTMHKKVGQRYIGEPIIYFTRDEMVKVYAYAQSFNGHFVTIQTGSGSFANGRKNWSNEYWQEVINYLSDHGIYTVHLGEKDNSNFENIFDFRGRLSIRESIAMIALADLHVGTVSSLMHAAHAIGTVAVIIYGGFERAKAHDYENQIAFESYIDCSPCVVAGQKIDVCPNNMQCMKEIKPKAVIAEIYKQLGSAILGTEE